MPGDPADPYPTALQLDEEQHVVRHLAAPTQHLRRLSPTKSSTAIFKRWTGISGWPASIGPRRQVSYFDTPPDFSAPAAMCLISFSFSKQINSSKSVSAA